MTSFVAVVLSLCAGSCAAVGAEDLSNIDPYWGQWRGPSANGTSFPADPPVVWGENRNIRWKVGIPGRGHASPIIWGDQVFILSAFKTDVVGDRQTPGPRARRRGPPTLSTQYVQKFEIFAIDRRTGKVNWQRTAHEAMPHESRHPTGSWASGSPITDGEHVYAYFGSQGLYCYDFKGSLKWKTDFGDMTIKLGFGEGSSPAIYDDKIVVIWDHERQSFLVALDKKTGKVDWKVDRDEITSWATPLIVDENGSRQIITSATGRVRSYDLETGKMIWECSGMTHNVIPTPVYADGRLYVTSGFRGNMLLAIQLSSAKGDITDSDAVLWRYDRDTPYTPSPLLYGNYLYFLKGNDGILSCLNAKTGAPYFGPQRVSGIDGIYASPVGANDRVYITGRNGTTVVIKARRSV